MFQRVPRIVTRGAALLLTGVLLGTLYPRLRPDLSARLLKELTREARSPGAAGSRLSIAASFAPCPAQTREGESVPRTVCASPGDLPSRHALGLIHRLEQEARRSSGDAAALHALGLASLLYASAAEGGLRQPIAYLQSAARLAERPAPVLADLAAAHLVQAERAQAPRDLYVALEVAQQALELDPANRAARFNAALALDRAGLWGEALREWRAYLQADSTSGWADEARRRIAAFRTAHAPLPTPDTAADAAQLAAFAGRAPRRARDLGWDRLMGDWAAAVLAGNATLARLRLAQAEAVASTLAARGGDASLADAVREARARAGEPAALRRLAELHRAFAAGRAESVNGQYAAAAAHYRRILTHPDAHTALREWARVMLGICAIYVPTLRDAPRLLGDAVARVDSARHPALAGRARWALAAALQKRGRYEESFPLLEAAAPLFHRARELDHQAAVYMAIGDAQSQLGTGAAAYENLHRATLMLRPHPGAVWRYSVLFVLGPALAADGLHRAALRVQDEAVTVAGEDGVQRYVGEARLARARQMLAAARPDVSADVVAGRRIMGEQKGFPREWLEHDLAETLGMAALRSDPAGADSLLTRVVEFFEARSHPGRLLPALYARAEARLARGHVGEAEADLDRAAAVLDTQQASFPTAGLRAALLEASRRVYDRSVILHLAAGRERQALEQVERSRASYSLRRDAPGRDRAPLRAPPGEVALELALIGDTLLAWTVSGDAVHLTRGVVDRDSLLREIEQVRSALELRAAEGALRPALQRLYARVIAPVQARLGRDGTPVIVVADGELSAIPFEALWDGRRYLVEAHPLRYVSTLRDPVRPAAPPRGLPVAVVADPAFDARAFPDLRPLPNAAAEALVVARLYPGARVLPGARADGAAVRQAFRAGGIAHFAGHAVFDDARPERSFLVVAGGRDDGRLTAAEIGGMDLSGLRLVVLSACQTVRGQPGRSGGFAGLAGAFLAAGAGGVVGSLWRVDDGHTRVLMEAFHAAYRASGDGDGALRQAQLHLLRSAEPALRSPAAWAGFRYAGG